MSRYATFVVRTWT